MKKIVLLICILCLVSMTGCFKFYIQPVPADESTTTPPSTTTPSTTDTTDTTTASNATEPVATIEPAASQQISLTLPETTGEKEIEFQRDLQAGEKVLVSITWNEEWSTGSWRVKIKPITCTGGPAIKTWANLTETSKDLEYVATTSDTCLIQIINLRSNNEHTGTMEISGSWTQTEF